MDHYAPAVVCVAGLAQIGHAIGSLASSLLELGANTETISAVLVVVVGLVVMRGLRISARIEYGRDDDKDAS